MIYRGPDPRVAAGHELVLELDNDREGELTWARHADSEVPWLDFADASRGVVSGTAVAGEGGLLVVTATNADGDVDTASVDVTVLGTGLQVVYDAVSQPPGTAIVAVPEVWGLFGRGTWRPVNMPIGFALDESTGIVSGPMPQAAVDIAVMLIDSAGQKLISTLELAPSEIPDLEPTIISDRTAPDGRPILGFVSGETADVLVQVSGAAVPLTASLEAAPAWVEVTDGDEVRIGGTTTPGGDGLIEIFIADASSPSMSGRLQAWAEVGLETPLQLVVPERITGSTLELWPEVYARVVGGRAPYTLVIESGTGSVNNVTRRLSGTFAMEPGVVPTRISATDALGAKVFATMQVETTAPPFAITQDDIEVAVNGTVNQQPTVAGGSGVARFWAKEGGPDWLSVSTTTGQITGTAPSAAESEVLSLYAFSTNGEEARLDVRVTVTQGAVTCSIPAINAVRGISGSVQITVNNAPAGFRATKTSGSALFTVSATGRISWGALDASDTDVRSIVVRVDRDPGTGTTTCSRTPTISDSAPTGTCTISGPALVEPGDTSSYGIATNLVGASFTIEIDDNTWSLSDTGGGRFRAGPPLGSEDDTATVTVTATSGTGTATCSRTITSGWGVGCSVPSLSATVGSSISGSMSASGRPGSSFTYSASGLPSGVSMSDSGSFSGGSGLSVGNYSFTVEVTDSFTSRTSTCSGSITIRSVTADPLSCTAPSPTIEEGSNVSGTARGSGGSGSYTFSASGLPSGVTMNSSGRLSGGSGLSTGEYDYTVTVNDGNTTETCTGTITVEEATPVLTCGATPRLTLTHGQSFSGNLPTPTNSVGAVSYSGVSNNPSWITISSDGSYSGTAPSTDTSDTWRYQATDSVGTCTGATGNISVGTVPLSCSAGSASGFRNERLTASVSGNGGAGGYSFALNASSDSGITLSGTTVTLAAQSSDGTFNYSVTVTDDDNDTATCSGRFTVSGTRLTLSNSGDSGGEPGDTIRGQLSASGGSGSGYVYSSSTSGVNVRSSGSWSYTISSSATRGTSFSLSFSVRDSRGARRSISPSFNVEYAPLRLSVGGATGGEPGDTIRGTLSLSGGTGSGYSYGGSTSGLTVNSSTGAWSYSISSSATRGGTVSLSFYGQDSRGSSSRVTAGRTINIEYEALRLRISGDSGGEPGEALSGSLSPSGGTGAGYVVGSATSGLSVNQTANTWSYTISNSATVGSSITLTFTLFDSRGSSVQRRFTRSISVQGPAVSVSSNDLGWVHIGGSSAAWSHQIDNPQLSVSGGTAPFSATVSASSGVRLSNSNAEVVSGSGGRYFVRLRGFTIRRATVSGGRSTLGSEHSITFTVSDSAGQSASGEITMTPWSGTIHGARNFTAPVTGNMQGSVRIPRMESGDTTPSFSGYSYVVSTTSTGRVTLTEGTDFNTVTFTTDRELPVGTVQSYSYTISTREAGEISTTVGRVTYVR